MRPAYHWPFEFGDAGDGTSCEKTRRTWEDYRGTRFYGRDRALAIKRWLHRVDDAFRTHVRRVDAGF